MEQALMKKPDTLPTQTTWQAMKDQAQVLIKSGFLPASIKTPEQALSVALAGRELGIGFMESIRSINVIQGKPTISPQLMLALANRTGELENIEIIPADDKCIVRLKRKGRTVYENEFGVKEATDLGLMAKDNYRKQKKVMFQWRALAANLRVTFPDVVLGLYTPEEMGAEVVVGEHEAMEVVHHEETKVIRPEVHEAEIAQPEALPEHKPETPKTPRQFVPSNAGLETVRTFVAKIEDKIIKSGKNAGEPYWVISDAEGVRYKCFSATVAAYATKAKEENRLVEIKYSVNPTYGPEIKFMVSADA